MSSKFRNLVVFLALKTEILIRSEILYRFFFFFTKQENTNSLLTRIYLVLVMSFLA